MNNQSRSYDTDDIEHFEQLRSQYMGLSSEQPDATIDRQIIAAAHRELAHPNAKKAYNIAWWRRISLPLYITASFTFTAVAAHWFWPGESIKTLPGTASSTVNFEIMPPSIEPQQELKKAQRQLPEPTQLLAPPNMSMSMLISKSVSQPPLLKTPKIQREKITELLQLKVESSNFEKAGLSANSRSGSMKSHYPDKESWAREIIDLMKQGQFERAKKELIAFKQDYPDYPIDEQLEVLR